MCINKHLLTTVLIFVKVYVCTSLVLNISPLNFHLSTNDSRDVGFKRTPH